MSCTERAKGSEEGEEGRKEASKGEIKGKRGKFSRRMEGKEGRKEGRKEDSEIQLRGKNKRRGGTTMRAMSLLTFFFPLFAGSPEIRRESLSWHLICVGCQSQTRLVRVEGRRCDI